MFLVPLTIITGILSLIILIIWYIKRKKRPSVETIILMIISVLSFVTGVFYIVAPLLNFLAKYNILPQIIILSEDEILGTAIITGLIFFFIGLDQISKNFKKKA